MKWWLTVFFLAGNQWVSGDAIENWGSRSYDSRIVCEENRQWAEDQTRRAPLPGQAVWVCNKGEPADQPPPPGREANQVPSDSRAQAYSGGIELLPVPAFVPLHPGLRLFTHRDEPWIKEDAIGLRFNGPLTPPLAENLRDLFLADEQVYNHIVLELDSPGGELRYVERIVETLQQVKKSASLVTRVMGAQVCASGCVAVYMQGTQRKASGASVWIFHGASGMGSNVPSEPDTEAYLALLGQSGVSAAFLQELRSQGYVSSPGNLFLSGYELLHTVKANIIQEMLPAWQPQDPVLPPIHPPR